MCASTLQREAYVGLHHMCMRIAGLDVV
jgi:hypothetical protein